MKLNTCNRDSLCVDCTSTECQHAGDIGADCPKYTCDNDKPHDCNHCEWMKSYIRIARNELRKKK